MVTAMHGYFALNLVFNPTLFYYLMSTYLTVHIYAWSRVFFTLYYRFKLFESYRFSVAMLTSVMLLIPSVVGIHGNIVMLIESSAVMLFFVTATHTSFGSLGRRRILANRPQHRRRNRSSNPSSQLLRLLTTLRRFQLQIQRTKFAHICKKVMSANVRHSTPQSKAKLVYKAINVSHDNLLTVGEFKDFFRRAGFDRMRESTPS